MSTSTGELFVELGCEELPASMVRPALRGLAEGLEGLLDGLGHGPITTWATPRRLAVSIADVASHRPASEELVTGPPADRGFDADGNPTKAAIGFARGKGLDVADLEVVEVPKRGKVVAARVTTGGESVVDLVREGLADLIDAVPFAKQMIWGEGGLSFGRPLQWVTALYDGAVIEGKLHGFPVANTSRGHRLSPGPVIHDGSAAWLEGLRAHHVEPDLDARKARIQGLLDEAAQRLGADPIVDDELLEEVTHLVEWPVLVIGTFDEDLLELPPRLLITSMKVHQRYFPVHRDGALTNRFVVISNNPHGDADTIAEGNARVIRARFYDARFFLAEDRKKSLTDHAAALPRMRWIRGLGTMADKSERLGELGERLARLTGAPAAATAQAGRLTKADLASQMVGEFPKLQGHMGQLYAGFDGHDPAVGRAIEEHYLPRFAGDDLAQSPAGIALALADRLDTLVGCFGIGLRPKGGGDPQGLRRAASGLVATILGQGLRVELAALFREAYDVLHAHAAAHPDHFGRWVAKQGSTPDTTVRDALVHELVGFTLTRFQAATEARGVSAEVVDAVLPPVDAVADEHRDLVRLTARIDALHEVVGTEAFLPVLHTLKRVLNITREAEDAVRPTADELTEAAERDLLAAVEAAEGRVHEAVEGLDYGAAIGHVTDLAAPVEAFFDAVMVMDPDEAVRARRIGLLLATRRLFLQIADFTRISTR